jgi:trigger factor
MGEIQIIPAGGNGTMSYKIEKSEKNMAKLTIEASAEELDKAIEEAYQKQKKDISIPGFRKGKVPRQMVEQMYGSQVFYEDAANTVIRETYPKTLEECTEEIVSQPKIEITQIEKGKTFIYTATVALKPPVKLGKYKGVEIEKVDAAVSDADVDAEIDREREKNARKVEVTDRAVKAKDEVKLNFDGSVDGVPFEGGKGEDYPLTIGSNAFIPGFEDQLIGAEIGKEKDVNVTFPEDYQEKTLAGKAAVFKCTVNSITESELPELNDEFASDVSEFGTLKEYKADVRGKLEESKAKEAKSTKQEEAIEEVIKGIEVDIPDAMLETEQRQMVDDFAQRMQMQGLSMEQYLQYTGSTYDRMIEQVKPQAEKRIKTRLALEEIAAQEKLKASDEDFEKEIKSMADSYNMEPDKIKEMLGEKEKEGIYKDLEIKMAMDLIADNAVEVEKKDKQ